MSWGKYSWSHNKVEELCSLDIMNLKDRWCSFHCILRRDIMKHFGKCRIKMGIEEHMILRYNSLNFRLENKVWCILSNLLRRYCLEYWNNRRSIKYTIIYCNKAYNLLGKNKLVWLIQKVQLLGKRWNYSK